jgi:hypothetical protein
MKEIKAVLQTFSQQYLTVFLFLQLLLSIYLYTFILISLKEGI